MVVLNAQLPLLLENIGPLNWEDVPLQMRKYVNVDSELFETLGAPARVVVASMLQYVENGYKSCLLDYKVRNLKVGDCVCPLTNWHIDCTRNPNHPSRPDVHLIYSTEVGTEFIAESIETDVDDFTLINFEGRKIVQALPDCIYQYNRYNVHRGPIVQKDCKRVMIRLTMTDII